MDVQMQKAIAEKLNREQISAATYGYPQLIYAISKKMENPRAKMKQIHNWTAEKFEVGTVNTGRNMRTAVQKNHPDESLSEFVSRIAIELKLENGESVF